MTVLNRDYRIDEEHGIVNVTIVVSLSPQEAIECIETMEMPHKRDCIWQEISTIVSCSIHSSKSQEAIKKKHLSRVKDLAEPPTVSLYDYHWQVMHRLFSCTE